MAGSRNDRGRAWRFGRSTFLAAVLAAILPAGHAGAGSIFMKNGYIIQGPVVECSEGNDGAVVMGWPNGKVTIYRRFIEKIDLEPAEEKSMKAAAEAQKPAIVDEVISAPGVEDELPQSLNDLVKSYIDSRNPTKGPPDGAAKPPEPETPGGEVTIVPPPGGEVVKPDPSAHPSGQAGRPAGEDLGDRVANTRWGFAIRPPRGWRLSEVEGCVSWSGPPGQDGFSPSMNIASLNEGGLKWEEACAALREDQAIPFRGYQLQAEDTLDVSGRPAFRVAGRGELAGKTLGAKRKVSVRQVLVEKGDRLWLISSFTSAAGGDSFAGLLDRSLETFQLDG